MFAYGGVQCVQARFGVGNACKKLEGSVHGLFAGRQGTGRLTRMDFSKVKTLQDLSLTGSWAGVR